MAEMNAAHLRSRLRAVGLSNSAITAAWPRWWSEDAESSQSAKVELRFSVARHLGLDPRSLLEDQEAPRFLWRDEARFKHLSGESDLEKAGITSFGRAVASILLEATQEPEASLAGRSAGDLRQAILDSGRPFVALPDLILLAWAVGVPVIHLRIFPWSRKRMAAMTVRLNDRWAILLGKDSQYPAPIAFYLGHELGHIATGQLADGRLIVDLSDAGPGAQPDDEEEQAADAFALELLTGERRPVVVPLTSGRGSASELARIALDSGEQLGIEPGVLAECFGYSTGNWRMANASIRRIYATAAPTWAAVNAIASRELQSSRLPDDAADFLDAVLGMEAAPS